MKLGKIFYINCSSLPAHIDEVRDLVGRHKPLVVFLSETCLTEEIEDHEVECEEYNFYRNDSHSRHTGGCGVYVRKDVKAEVSDTSTLPTMVWILSLKLSNGGQNYKMSVVYFSPNASKKRCIEHFENWCEDKMEMGENNLVCGDFNVNLLKYGTYQTKMRSIININGMKQHVDGATRITEESKSKIDLVMSNLNVEVEVLLNEKISDHSTLEIKIDGFSAKEEEVEYVDKIMDYSSESLRQWLSEFDWDTRNKSLNEKANFLTEKLNVCVQRFVKRQVRKKYKLNGWFDGELHEARRKRDEAYAQAVMRSDRREWMKYRRLRNNFLYLLRTKKRKYMEKKLNDAKGGTKEMWKILKTLLNGKKNNKIKEIEINGEVVSDSHEMS